MRPVAIDLFCGAGGASMGLHRAGFDVRGIDIKPQPEYPVSVLVDWMLKPRDCWHGLASRGALWKLRGWTRCVQAGALCDERLAWIRLGNWGQWVPFSDGAWLPRSQRELTTEQLANEDPVSMLVDLETNEPVAELYLYPFQEAT